MADAPRSPKQKLVESFEAWMLGRGYSPVTVKSYSAHVRKGADDILSYLRNQRSWQGFKLAQEAFRHLAHLCGRPETIPAILAVPAPRRPPKKPLRVVPLDVWRALGPRALQEYPGALGWMLWLTYYSGLRIGDVVTISRQQATEAIATGETTIRQKGLRGLRQRRWRPLSIVRPALEALLKEPGWGQLWASISSGPEGARNRVRNAIPKPWHPHVFRHAVASYLYAAGVPYRTIMEVGGWESVGSLMRYQDFVPAAMMQDADERLSTLIFGAPKVVPPAGGRLSPSRGLPPGGFPGGGPGAGGGPVPAAPVGQGPGRRRPGGGRPGGR